MGSISSAEDMLTVYESSFGGIGAELWRVQKGGGLSGEPPLMYREFRVAVEQTPEPAKKKPEKKPE
jgi:hypothetical protein